MGVILNFFYKPINNGHPIVQSSSSLNFLFLPVKMDSIVTEVAARKLSLHHSIPKHYTNIIGGISSDGAFGWIAHQTILQVINLSSCKVLSAFKFKPEVCL